MIDNLALKAERIKRGYTQIDVASMIGVNVKDYSRRERGDGEFSIDYIIKISKSLKLSLADFNRIFFKGEIPLEKVEIADEVFF